MDRAVDWGQTAFSAVTVAFFLQAQVLYPFLLLLSFGIVFAVHSVYASQHQEDVEQPKVTGPGGKPLPVTRIKVERSRARAPARQDFSHNASIYFKTGTAIVVLTFMVHGLHVLRQCMQASWADAERFTNDELNVSAFSTNAMHPRKIMSG